jgi:hypothetical protein
VGRTYGLLAEGNYSFFGLASNLRTRCGGKFLAVAFIQILATEAASGCLQQCNDLLILIFIVLLPFAAQGRPAQDICWGYMRTYGFALFREWMGINRLRLTSSKDRSKTVSLLIIKFSNLPSSPCILCILLNIVLIWLFRLSDSASG